MGTAFQAECKRKGTEVGELRASTGNSEQFTLGGGLSLYT